MNYSVVTTIYCLLAGCTTFSKCTTGYSKYYDQMKTKLAYTIDQWINKVEKHLDSSEKDDW